MLVHWITFFTLPIFNEPSHCAHLHYLPGSLKYLNIINVVNFPSGSNGKASAYNAGDPGSIPGSGRSRGEGYGTPLQYSCLENPMDRGAWGYSPQARKESDMIERFHFTSVS